MALDDHRYLEEKWLRVLNKIILSPQHRIKLLENPEAISEKWGFCMGGRAFLRVLNALKKHYGEKQIQIWVDRFLDYYTQHPEIVLMGATLFAQTGSLRSKTEWLDRLAVKLGYSSEF